MVTINIELISDPICTWCFIAHRTLFKSIQLYQKTFPNGSADNFNVTYRPYYLLDPSTLPSNKQEFQDKIMMSRKRQTITYTRIKQIGRAYGISFNFFEGEMISGTRETHRLIQLAQSRKSPKIRDEVVEGIFRAFHENGLDVSDWELLRTIAISAGITVAEVDEWRSQDNNTDVGGEELDREVERVRNVVNSGVANDKHGVPVLIVQGAYRVDGAPDVSELLDIFGKIKNKENVEGVGSGFICEIGSTQC